MIKEWYLGKSWIAYFTLNKPKNFTLGFRIGISSFEFDLLFLSFGFWR